MTVGQAIERRPEAPGHSDALALEEVKARLAGGTLAAALPAALPALLRRADGRPQEITGVRLRQEKHRRENVSIVLDVDVLAPGAGVPAARSLVLHYPRTGSPPGSHAGRAPLAWWYPTDPFLPALQLTEHPEKLLASGDWRTTDGRSWAPNAGYAARRLGYKPGQRASFALDAGDNAGGSAPPMVLKIVRREAFDELLQRAMVVGASPLRKKIALPRLIAVSHLHQAFLYDYQAGRGLDTLAPADLARLRPVLAAEFRRLTGLIHRTDPTGLPVWSAQLEMAKSRPLVEQVLHRCPAAAAELLAVVTRLGRECGRPVPAGQLIHNDFTARNLLCASPSRAGEIDQAQMRPTALTLIDWDSAVAGPVERDVAAFLSARLLDEQGASTLVEQYGRRPGGGPLDRALINGLMAHQRLLKACRRYLASGLDGRLIDDVQLVTQRLDRNPLVG